MHIRAVCISGNDQFLSTNSLNRKCQRLDDWQVVLVEHNSIKIVINSAKWMSNLIMLILFN